MVLTAKNFGKVTLVALGAAALASPSFAPMAQEGDAAAEAVTPLTDAEVESSRALFSQYGCGTCHSFADANGYGHIGPALDGNDTLTIAYVDQIISNGQGAMPSFGGMVSEEEIDTLAQYIVENKAD